MSEGLAYGDTAPPPRRTQPAYGDARLSSEASPKVEDDLDRRTHIMLALAVFTPVAAAYGAVAYGVYLAAEAIF